MIARRAVLIAPALAGLFALAGFAETESPAVWLLGEQEMTQQDAENFILHGILKGSGDAAA